MIGADGANGTTGRGAGLDDHLRTVALEGNAAVDLERFTGRAWIEFGVVPGGYGWVFPKGDHVNVGVGGWHEEGPGSGRTSHACAASTGSPSRR